MHSQSFCQKNKYLPHVKKCFIFVILSECQHFVNVLVDSTIYLEVSMCKPQLRGTITPRCSQ